MTIRLLVIFKDQMQLPNTQFQDVLKL